MDAWQDLATRIRNGNSFSGREPNSCFLNTRSQRFADISMMSGLGLADDARSIATVDWDHDGDLDLWITNRTAPRLRFLRNDYVGGQSLSLTLQGDPANATNRDAIGAVVTVTLADGKTLVKTVTAGNGFLSQSSKTLHFGLDTAKFLKSAQVQWKSGQPAETFAKLVPGKHYRLIQGRGQGQVLASKLITLIPKELTETEKSTIDVSLTKPKPAPRMVYLDWNGKAVSIDTKLPTVVLLWASWCQPCLRELAELKGQAAVLKNAGLQLIALNVEEAQAASQGLEAPKPTTLQRSLQKLAWPFASGRATEGLVKILDNAQRSVLYKQEALPLPSSFFWQSNQLISFSKGPLSIDHLQNELARLKQPSSKHADHALPFPGRWSTDHFITNPMAIANVYLQGGYARDARDYLAENLEKLDRNDVQKAKLQEADLRFMIGETLRLENKPPSEALPFYAAAARLNPLHPKAIPAYARALSAAKRGSEAVPLLQSLLRQQPQRADLQIQLGNICQGLLRDEEAVRAYIAALTLKPNDFQATTQLCWVQATSADVKVLNTGKALALAQKLLKSHSRNPYALDSSAAALAANDRFPQAIEVLKRALQIVQRSGNDNLFKELQQRLMLYQKAQAFVRR